MEPSDPCFQGVSVQGFRLCGCPLVPQNSPRSRVIAELFASPRSNVCVSSLAVPGDGRKQPGRIPQLSEDPSLAVAWGSSQENQSQLRASAAASASASDSGGAGAAHVPGQERGNEAEEEKPERRESRAAGCMLMAATMDVYFFRRSF